mmetsp:Transcript_47505/g.107688  ORF Transcript_47505/g.107688 Transcript_47505/m.107688 type:complete len:202 (-) Transcript_47505:270-875(-)
MYFRMRSPGQEARPMPAKTTKMNHPTKPVSAATYTGNDVFTSTVSSSSVAQLRQVSLAASAALSSAPVNSSIPVAFRMFTSTTFWKSHTGEERVSSVKEWYTSILCAATGTSAVPRKMYMRARVSPVTKRTPISQYRADQKALQLSVRFPLTSTSSHASYWKMAMGRSITTYTKIMRITTSQNKAMSRFPQSPDNASFSSS